MIGEVLPEEHLLGDFLARPQSSTPGVASGFRI